MKFKREISKLILKKSNSYLKLSITIFLISLLLVSTASIFFINQYIQVERDFINNNNTHIIEISSIRTEDGSFRFLKFKDKDTIKRNIGAELSDVKHHVFTEYQLNFGISDTQDNVHFLYGLDEEMSHLLGDFDFEMDTIYSEVVESDVTILRVPSIIIDDFGLSSGEAIDYEVSNKDGVYEKNPLNLYGETFEKKYVGSETYKKIIKLAYGVQWDEFMIQFDKVNPYGIQAINNMYVYVDSIADVEKTARVLDSAGFNTNYTFQAFDNFDASIKNTIMITVALAAIILGITTVHVVLSFNSYLKIQQKDMGILRQKGHDSSAVFSIYEVSINSILGKIALVVEIFTVILGLIFIDIHFFNYIVITMTAILLLIVIINRFIVLHTLKRYVNMDILDLLKTNKEFE